MPQGPDSCDSWAGACPRPVRSLSLSEPWEPVITRPDPMSPAEWEALLAASLDEVEPPGDDEDEDPESCALPWDEDLAVIEAETARIAAERAADAEFLALEDTAELAGRVAADQARKRGPRGPGTAGGLRIVSPQCPQCPAGPAWGVRRGGSASMPRPGQRPCTLSWSRRRSGRLGESPEDEIVGLITAADRAEAAVVPQARRGGQTAPPPSRSRLYAYRTRPDAGVLSGLGRG